MKVKGHILIIVRLLMTLFLCLHVDLNFASSVNDMTVGSVAAEITTSFSDLARGITAASYLAGLGFSFNVIMKFKQHFNNPTQNSVGAPIAMLFIGSSFLFFPSILGITGQTLFGGAQTTAGPIGMIIGSPNMV